MRLTILVFLLSLSAMYPLWDTVRSNPCCPGHIQQHSNEDLCVSDADEHAEPATIEDRALVGQLVEQAAQLLKEGKTAKMADLIQQLDIGRCELQIPEPTELADNPVEIYANGKQGVVVVGSLYTCKKCGKFHANVASGFVLTATGAVVTNCHVVDHRETEALVVMTDRRQVLPVRRILAASRTDDVAILKVDAEGLPTLPVAAGLDAAPVGSPVGVISHPAGRLYCYTSGVVSRYSKIQSAGQKVDTVWITADFARGSSGAPVLNPKGQVVAVVRSTESIFHGGGAGQPNSLQMVFKSCTPAANLLGLLASRQAAGG